MSGTSKDTAFWDRAARKYAAGKISDMAGYERTLERARQLLKSTDSVLELGCGTGTTALKLAPSVARIVATDISGEMIAIARERAVAQDCSNVEFVTAPADAPVAGSFDAVLAFNVLHLTRDRAAVLARALAQLKPGGLLITKTPCLSEMNVLIRLAVPVMQWIGKAPFVVFQNAEEAEAEIANAGFTIIERARHGSGRRDARIFIAARKPE